jgi:hypothetical protein
MQPLAPDQQAHNLKHIDKSNPACTVIMMPILLLGRHMIVMHAASTARHYLNGGTANDHGLARPGSNAGR